MNNILPIFKTQGSFHKSLLTSENEDEISSDYSISVISITKKYKLNKIIVIDDTFFSFLELYKNCIKNNIQLIFGINFCCCKDAKEKSEKSIKTENKISILMNNSGSYKDLLRIHNLINTNQEYFYYKSRIDYSIIKSLWTENLSLLIPPFDNFIHQNLLYDSICVPDFGKIKPTMTFANQELPYQEILNENIKNYASNNDFNLKEVHNVCYYRNKDIKSYCVKRAIEKRSNFSSPEIPYFCSDKFSFEEYCRKVNVEFIC